MFIVIEALDAGGSQTQTDLLVNRLEDHDHPILQLHFPQEDRATGRLIYEKFLFKKNTWPFSRREQALLYVQDFYSRVEDIRATLAQPDHVVVSDRFCTSTMAYQTIGTAGAERKKLLRWLEWLCFEDDPALPRPDLVIFIDTPVTVSLRRLSGKKKDFFENRQKLNAIRRSYLQLARDQAWHIVAAVDEAGKERRREAIHEEIWQAVLAQLA